MTLREKKIDMSNVNEEDLVIKNIVGNSLSIQLDGNGAVSISGRQYTSDESYSIGMVNMSTLAKQTSITAPGIYLVVVEGIDEIKLEVNGTGNLCWKELGD